MPRHSLKLLFAYVPAEDDTVDPQWEYLGNRKLCIQDCRSYGGGYMVNKYEGEGASLSMTYLGEYRSLTAAMEFIVQVAK